MCLFLRIYFLSSTHENEEISPFIKNYSWCWTPLKSHFQLRSELLCITQLKSYTTRNFFIWRTKLKEHSNQLKYFFFLRQTLNFFFFLNYLFTRIRIIYVVCAFEILILCKIWFLFTFNRFRNFFFVLRKNFFEDYFWCVKNFDTSNFENY